MSFLALHHRGARCAWLLVLLAFGSAGLTACNKEQDDELHAEEIDITGKVKFGPGGAGAGAYDAVVDLKLHPAHAAYLESRGYLTWGRLHVWSRAYRKLGPYMVRKDSRRIYEDAARCDYKGGVTRGALLGKYTKDSTHFWVQADLYFEAKVGGQSCLRAVIFGSAPVKPNQEVDLVMVPAWDSIARCDFGDDLVDAPVLLLDPGEDLELKRQVDATGRVHFGGGGSASSRRAPATLCIGACKDTADPVPKPLTVDADFAKNYPNHQPRAVVTFDLYVERTPDDLEPAGIWPSFVARDLDRTKGLYFTDHPFKFVDGTRVRIYAEYVFLAKEGATDQRLLRVVETASWPAKSNTSVNIVKDDWRLVDAPELVAVSDETLRTWLEANATDLSAN